MTTTVGPAKGAPSSASMNALSQGVDRGDILRSEQAPGSGPADLDQAVVVEPLPAGGHGGGRIAEERVVGPQGRADEADAMQNDRVAIEKMDAGSGAGRLPGGEAFLHASPVELVVSGHVDDGMSGKAGRRGQAVDRALGGAVDVAREYGDLERRERLGQRPGRSVLEMQVGEHEQARHGRASPITASRAATTVQNRRHGASAGSST